MLVPQEAWAEKGLSDSERQLSFYAKADLVKRVVFVDGRYVPFPRIARSRHSIRDKSLAE